MKYFLYLLITTFFALAVYAIYYSQQTNWLFGLPIALVVIGVVISTKKASHGEQRREVVEHSVAEQLAWWQSPFPYIGAFFILAIISWLAMG